MLEEIKRYSLINSIYTKKYKKHYIILAIQTVALVITISIIVAKFYPIYFTQKIGNKYIKNNIYEVKLSVEKIKKEKSQKQLNRILNEKCKNQENIEFLGNVYCHMPITGTTKQYYAVNMNKNVAKYVKYDILFGDWFDPKFEETSYTQAIIPKEMILKYKLNHFYNIKLWNGKNIKVKIIGILKNNYILDEYIDEKSNTMLILDDNKDGFDISSDKRNFQEMQSFYIRGNKKQICECFGATGKNIINIYDDSKKNYEEDITLLKNILKLALGLFILQVIGILSFFINLINSEKKKILIYRRVGAKSSDIRRMYLIETLKFIILPEIVTTVFLMTFSELFGLNVIFSLQIIMLIIVLLEVLISSCVIAYKIKAINLSGKE